MTGKLKMLLIYKISRHKILTQQLLQEVALLPDITEYTLT
jgi:hypothetical protein